MVVMNENDDQVLSSIHSHQGVLFLKKKQDKITHIGDIQKKCLDINLIQELMDLTIKFH